MRKYQTGSTMIEVIVSILIISIGLLGIAGTQTLGLANSQSALHRSYAAQLSTELADAMRLSPNNLGAYAPFATTPATLTEPAARDGECLSAGEACNAAAMADIFLNDWEARIENNLPDGEAEISLDDDLYIVEIRWKDLRSNQTRQIANEDALERAGSTAAEAAANREYITFTTSFQL